MALFGLVAAFLGACVADLKGSDKTRPFTRRAFWLVVLLELGVGVEHVIILVDSIPIP